MSSYILEGGGKRVRPLLLILSARASGYEGPDDVLVASLIEWIHAATLLHDDVLDEADVRRERPTVRKKWGNRLSVFMGDYAYFHAVSDLIRMQNSALAPCLLQACNRMVLGELMQLEQGTNPKSESAYLRIVEHKTGALMAATCQAGGLLAGAAEPDSLALFRFGLALGVAFQLMDDALDYVAPPGFGKQQGQDLRQGLVTLPLLHLQYHSGDSERGRLQDVLLTRAFPNETFEWVKTLLARHGSIEYTFALAHHYRDMAKQHLAQFKGSIYKEALLAFTDMLLKHEQS
jgi:octaprenyl-diphosphate synthase